MWILVISARQSVASPSQAVHRIVRTPGTYNAFSHQSSGIPSSLEGKGPGLVAGLWLAYGWPTAGLRAGLFHTSCK